MYVSHRRFTTVVNKLTMSVAWPNKGLFFSLLHPVWVVASMGSAPQSFKDPVLWIWWLLSQSSVTLESFTGPSASDWQMRRESVRKCAGNLGGTSLTSTQIPVHSFGPTQSQGKLGNVSACLGEKGTGVQGQAWVSVANLIFSILFLL